MMTNKKILYGILVFLLIIVGIGLFVLNRPITISPPETTTVPPTDITPAPTLTDITPAPALEVIVITDKIEYEQGEIAKIMVRNNLSQVIWYAKEIECGESFWKVEKLMGNTEELLDHGIFCLWDYPQNDVTELKPGEELNAKWDLRVLNTTTFERKFVGKGTYRIAFYYTLQNLTDEDWYYAWIKRNKEDLIKTSYSNEFTIK